MNAILMSVSKSVSTLKVPICVRAIVDTSWKDRVAQISMNVYIRMVDVITNVKIPLVATLVLAEVDIFSEMMEESVRVDIDECLDGNSECIHHCENLPGKYACICLPGHQGDPLVDCQDVDECQEGTSACEQGCFNTPGSFQCICQPGYSLDSNRRTCSTHNACEDGNHGCEHICQSLRGQASCSCYPGYSLASDNRTCIDMDECEEGIDLCDQECHNTNGSYICSCEFGFVLSQDSKSCRDICVPHSCRHGRCVPSEDNTPACDCTDSGYEGQHCEMGVITVQEMPSLIAGETYPITIEARPDSDLTIVPMSDHVEFIPPTLMFTSEQTSLQTTVIPKKSGELTAVLQLFGSSARAYQQAQFYLSVLSAFEKFDISDFSLPWGCHDEFLSQCPAPSTLFLALSSTSTWYQLKGNSNVRYTLGIVFLDVSGFRLPISLKGIQIIQTTWQFTIQALPTTIKEGDGLVINSNQNTEAKCSDFNVTVYDIEEFIENDSFLRTFIAGLVEKLPDWIKLIYRGMEYVSFNDISASMNQGKDLVGISSCRGAPVYNDYLYTTFQFKGNANVSVFGEMVSLPDPLVGRKFCLLVDICNDFLGTVILMFPKDSRIDLATFSFLNFLADKNWSLTLGGIGLSYSRKLSPIETDVELWNGDHYFSYEQPLGYNAWMKFHVSKDDDGDGKIGFSVDGQLTIMLSVQDLEKALTHILVARWDALILFKAGLNLHFRLKIFGQQVDISFEALRATAIGYLSIGGFGRKWCGESADPPGLFLNLLFNIQPFGNSPLAQFFLPRIDIIVSAFLNYDVSDKISSMPFDDSIITPLINALKPDIQQLLNLITNFTTSLHSHLDQAISKELSNLRTQATELRTEIENTIRSLPTSMLKDIPDIVSPLKTSVHGLQTSWKNFKNELVTRSHHLKSDVIVYMESYVNETKKRIDKVVKNYLYHMLSLKNGCQV
ncbi:uncharacterized protein [Ptychodera flava]|uniref:uncharacterized protein n=1 Tax=Ptychodera flava TaxID=63121 RepID=UPI00396AA830